MSGDERGPTVAGVAELDAAELDARLAPETLPYLAQFLAAYLHEDLAPVHGSAARAAYEFATEADFETLDQLAGDWWTLRFAARKLPLERLRRILGERFRSAWYPASVAEIEAVGEELERALEP